MLFYCFRPVHRQGILPPGVITVQKSGAYAGHLSILKTGKAKAVRFSTLDVICKALDCQPADIPEYQRDEA
ncbi:helix-turn-helix domain-containing protein [Chitinophaga oryzae]|uniref:Helix-turn-helix domain-containing protein n=1 Tax=Chitinophaga oryzae TaxID=2725414 RepID=A0AAE6ZMZ2_9BACT|nr:helix-turn-helix domain-containing protein [Chitinophaga oryzae]